MNFLLFLFRVLLLYFFFKFLLKVILSLVLSSKRTGARNKQNNRIIDAEFEEVN